MSSKQIKFLAVEKFFKFLQEKKNSVCVFVHVSDMSILESNKVQALCQNSNIKSSYIKINLLKKLTRKNAFTNILSGPTKLFFFDDASTIINFFKNPLISRKCFPLAAFFGNKLYTYSFFLGGVKKLGQDESFHKNLDKQINSLIINVKSKNITFIQDINKLIVKTLFVLNMIVKIKSKNGDN